MKGKKFLAFALTVAMMAGGALSVSAAGVSDVFSGDYYAGKYADVKAGVGTDTAELLKHAVTYGIKEGRVVSPILDVAAYRKAYADLDAAFGDNWDAYVDHYLNFGIKEKRTSGVLFDLVDYANKNADIKAAYGDDYAAIAQHYVTYGIKEGRPGGAIVKETPKAAASSSSSSSSSGSSSSSNTTVTTPTPVYPQQDTTLAQHKHSHEDYDWSVVFTEYKLNNGVTPSWPDWYTNNPTRSTKEPTCTEDGYVEWRCNENVYREIKNAKGEIVATQVIGTCDKIMHVVWPKSHKIMQGQNNAFLLAPTCQKDGTAIYTCTACGLQQTETLPKVKHQLAYSKTFAPVSCAKDGYGYDLYTCIFNCGYTEQKNKVTVEHQVATYDNVKKVASCIEYGLASGYCSKCGEEDTKKVAPLGHAFHELDADGKETDTLNTATRFVDSYTSENAALLGLGEKQRCHTQVDLIVCVRCNLIGGQPDVDDPDVKDPKKCTDDDENGWCDDCNHSMGRVYTEQVMEFHKGDILHNEVGQ